MPYVRERVHGRTKLTYQRLRVIAWTEPGGIVWVGVATWLLIFLGTYAVTAGYVPAQYFGLPYDLPAARLNWSDVRHLRLGGAIAYLDGQLLIDPGADTLLFVTMDSTGRVTTHLRPSSRSGAASVRRVAVLQPGAGAAYADVIAALDLVLANEVPVHAIWIATPSDMPSN